MELFVKKKKIFEVSSEKSNVESNVALLSAPPFAYCAPARAAPPPAPAIPSRAPQQAQPQVRRPARAARAARGGRAAPAAEVRAAPLEQADEAVARLRRDRTAPLPRSSRMRGVRSSRVPDAWACGCAQGAGSAAQAPVRCFFVRSALQRGGAATHAHASAPGGMEQALRDSVAPARGA